MEVVGAVAGLSVVGVVAYVALAVIAAYRAIEFMDQQPDREAELLRRTRMEIEA